MTSRSPRAWKLSLCLLFGYWALAFVATHLPGDTVSRLGRGFHFRFEHMDKVAHVLLYAGLSCLMMWFFHHRGLSRGTAMLLTMAVAFTYGGIDEWLQGFIPRRSTDLKDWVADAIGVLSGILIFCFAHPVLARWFATSRGQLTWAQRES